MGRGGARAWWVGSLQLQLQPLGLSGCDADKWGGGGGHGLGGGGWRGGEGGPVGREEGEGTGLVGGWRGGDEKRLNIHQITADNGTHFI